MTVLESAKAFGKAVGAARGSMDQPNDKKANFAKLMGTTPPTLTKWEEGHIGSIGRTVEERRPLAERLVAVSGCPPEWFGLSEPEPGEVERLREIQAEQALAQTQLSEELAEAQTSQQEMLKRIERLERGGEGTGSQ